MSRIFLCFSFWKTIFEYKSWSVQLMYIWCFISINFTWHCTFCHTWKLSRLCVEFDCFRFQRSKILSVVELGVVCRVYTSSTSVQKLIRIPLKHSQSPIWSITVIFLSSKVKTISRRKTKFRECSCKIHSHRSAKRTLVLVSPISSTP